KKFRPEHRIICRLATYSNRNTYEYRWKPQEERINIYQVEQWYLNDWQRTHELYNYRFGYLKLAPLKPNQNELNPGTLLSGVSGHYTATLKGDEIQQRSVLRVSSLSRNHRDVHDLVKTAVCWLVRVRYDEDGAHNGISFVIPKPTRHVHVSNGKRWPISVDLCRIPDALKTDAFRDITCTVAIGARNCYMSAQNIYGSYAGRGQGYESENTARFPTHYGQVCCYDDAGHLMQTSYQPVIKVTPDVPYNPGFPMRAYEFGTAPYMGQYEVPGLSAFHNDYMPYFLCCKFADFRCQMFYWRRPSSGCQEYQPPAYGEGMGAGTFNTIDNDKFIFNEPGVFNVLYIPQTLQTPEVKIQLRLERYPDRRVDFSLLGRGMAQQDLVQPTNVTVITGIVMEATGTDRVHVLTRKDTRRFRYRTSIIVGNIMRYFDTMRIQRFKGVLVYVNNVERGQPEIYVVLEEAQIGVRIRESYAIDVDRYSNYQESMGMLNVALSVPPQYGVRPDGDKTRETELRQRYNLPRVAGLMRPFPDQTSASFMQTLTLNDVNSETYRQQIINMYRVQGSGEPGSDQNLQTQNQAGMPTENMFTTSKDEDKKFEV
ncbi:AMOP domain protein, partial [Ostertagia ostertagi]